MLFNTLDFALFFLAVLAAYYALPHRWQNRMLLLASYFFYAYWDWLFLFLIWASTLSVHRSSVAIQRSEDPRRRLLILTAAVAANLGILAVFKYYNFMADSLTDLLSLVGLSASAGSLRLLLPVGISFYTFQAIGYVVDVYRGEIEAESSLSDVALFIAFFPQLVAGPIERAGRLLPQLKTERANGPANVMEGGHLICWGLFKKVFIADNLALFVEKVFDQPYPDLDGLTVLFALYAFAFQIYCDFSGYTDIARGAAKCLGIDLTLNFNLPYFAVSPRDLWRRWHVSLSEWLRDYVYIPMGGSRHGTAKTYRNLMLTMALGGLWHGAAWRFVFWGLYHGLLLAAHRLLARKETPELEKSPRTAVRFVWWSVRVFVMFHLVCFSWLIFRAADLGQVLDFSRLLFLRFRLSADVVPLAIHLIFYIWPLIVIQGWQKLASNQNVLGRLPWPCRSLIYAAGTFLFVIFGAFESREFIYFQF